MTERERVAHYLGTRTKIEYGRRSDLGREFLRILAAVSDMDDAEYAAIGATDATAA